MTAHLLERLGLVLRGTVPLLLTLGLVMATVVSSPIPDLAPVTPSLSVMAVYYWSIYRPDLLPAAAVFLIGLMQDILSGGPPGMMALVLLLVHGVVVSQRQVFVGKSFLVGWWGFAIVAIGAAGLSWLVASAWFGVFLRPRPVAYQAALTIALYPLVAWLFRRLHQKVLRGI